MFTNSSGVSGMELSTRLNWAYLSYFTIHNNFVTGDVILVELLLLAKMYNLVLLTVLKYSYNMLCIYISTIGLPRVFDHLPYCEAHTRVFDAQLNWCSSTMNHSVVVALQFMATLQCHLYCLLYLYIIITIGLCTWDFSFHSIYNWNVGHNNIIYMSGRAIWGIIQLKVLKVAYPSQYIHNNNFIGYDI